MLIITELELTDKEVMFPLNFWFYVRRGFATEEPYIESVDVHLY